MPELFAILASIGLANILKYGEILNPVRNILFKVSFFRNLFSCCMCLGFWAGFIIYAICLLVLGCPTNYLLLPLVASCCFQIFDSTIDALDQVYLYLKNRNNPNRYGNKPQK